LPRRAELQVSATVPDLATDAAGHRGFDVPSFNPD